MTAMANLWNHDLDVCESTRYRAHAVAWLGMSDPKTRKNHHHVPVYFLIPLHNPQASIRDVEITFTERFEITRVTSPLSMIWNFKSTETSTDLMVTDVVSCRLFNDFFERWAIKNTTEFANAAKSLKLVRLKTSCFSISTFSWTSYCKELKNFQKFAKIQVKERKPTSFIGDFFDTETTAY
jgi:ligand-binding SRPBCC domain-containing protein